MPPPARHTTSHRDAALTWLQRSIAVHHGRGSAAYYSRWRRPLRPWAPAYPETTGYLLETLLHYRRTASWIDPAIRSCTEWLLSVQHPSGAFPALYANSGRSSIFNTGMILFGLAAVYEDQPAPHIEKSLRRALHWLLDQLNDEYLWPKAGYQPNFVPAYYCRVIWAILRCHQILPLPEIPAAMEAAFNQHLNYMNPNGTVTGWGFQPDKPAHTHTIAYTLRGLFEASHLLHKKEVATRVAESLDKLEFTFQKNGKLAGQYDLQWQGDYQYTCTPGNLQLAILAFRLNRPTFGTALIHRVLPAQNMKPGSPNYGGLPGSIPVYGRYMRLKYPNWGLKFLLDALLFLPED